MVRQAGPRALASSFGASLTWPLELASALSGLHDDAHGYLSWATWAVDALYYLDDLDQPVERHRWITAGHNEDTLDLAHARWAASTAMTALDLSAAAVGAHHGASVQPDRAHDVADLTKNHRGLLCPGGITWLDGVVNDPNYKILENARHPLVHRTLPRTIYLSVGSGPAMRNERLGLTVPGAPGPTGKVSSRQLIEISRDTATRHVVALLQAAKAGQV